MQRRHDTAAARKTAGVDPTLWHEFAPGQRVMTREGIAGTVDGVEDGPHPGNEHYLVTLDRGLGGGQYSAGELRPLGTTSSRRTAAKTAEVETLPIGWSETTWSHSPKQHVMVDGDYGTTRALCGATISEANIVYGEVSVSAFLMDGPHCVRCQNKVKGRTGAKAATEPRQASEDYPELGTVLEDRPPLEHAFQQMGALVDDDGDLLILAQTVRSHSHGVADERALCSICLTSSVAGEPEPVLVFDTDTAHATCVAKAAADIEVEEGVGGDEDDEDLDSDYSTLDAEDAGEVVDQVWSQGSLHEAKPYGEIPTETGEGFEWGSWYVIEQGNPANIIAGPFSTHVSAEGWVFGNDHTFPEVGAVAHEHQLQYARAASKSPVTETAENLLVTHGYGPDRWSFDWCFAGETEFLTYDGYRTFKEVVGTTQKVLDGRGIWVEAEVRAFGEQPLRRITLKKGRGIKVIYATGNHRWLVQRTSDRVETDDLQRGDALVERLPRSYIHNWQPSPFGIAHGIVFGDGTLPSETIVGTSRPGGSRIDLWGEKDAQLLRYFEGHKTVPAKGGNNQQVTGVRVTGLPRHFKERPSLDADAPYLYGWLAGYFAADGRIGANGSNIEFSSADRENLEFVQAICARLTIATHDIRTVERTGCSGRGRIHDYRMEKDGRCSLCETPRLLHTLALVPETLREEFFLIEEHRQRFAQREGSQAKHGKLGSWTVSSVEETDRVEEVYCAVVPTTESFVLQDNILTSNCRFRRNRDCYYPKELDVEGTKQAGYPVWVPNLRGACPRHAWDEQKACPVAEPGPKSNEPKFYPDATVSWSEGGQRWERFGRFASKDTDDFTFQFTAAWRDVQAKAARIRQEGGVRIISSPTKGSSNEYYIVAEVRGDTNVYQTRLMRQPGKQTAVAMWTCGCAWGHYAWGRSGRWKRYEGRLCSHALAVLYEAQSQMGFDRSQPMYEHPKVPEWRRDTEPQERYPAPPKPEWRVGNWRPVDLDQSEQPPIRSLGFMPSKPIVVRYRGRVTQVTLEDDGILTDRHGEPVDPHDLLHPRFHPRQGLDPHDRGEYEPLFKGSSLHTALREGAVQPLPAVEAAADMNGAMVAIRPPQRILNVLRATGEMSEDFSNLHVTIAYFGDRTGLDVAGLKRAVYAFAADAHSITARISGYAIWKDLQGKRILVATIDSPGIEEWRARLVDHLAGTGISPMRTHGFVPHITMAYGYDKTEVPASQPRGDFSADSIHIVLGSDWEEVPLGGGASPYGRAASLETEAYSNAPPHEFVGMPPAYQICDVCDMVEDHSVHDVTVEPAAESDEFAFEGEPLARASKATYAKTCDFCDQPATKAIIWAEGKAYVPACDDHVQDAKDAIDDPSDIDFVRDIKDGEKVAAWDDDPEAGYGTLYDEGFGDQATDGKPSGMAHLEGVDRSEYAQGVADANDGVLPDSTVWSQWGLPEDGVEAAEDLDLNAYPNIEANRLEEVAEAAQRYADDLVEAELHEGPEPALPQTDGEEDEPGDDDERFTSMGSLLDEGSRSWLMENGSRDDDHSTSDIAARAKQVLAAKAFTPEEQATLINEGEDGTTARNLSDLDIAGTHYEVLQRMDDEDDELDVWDLLG